MAWTSSECLTSAHRKQSYTLLQYIFFLTALCSAQKSRQILIFKGMNSGEYLLRPRSQSPVPDNEWISYAEEQLVNKIV